MHELAYLLEYFKSSGKNLTLYGSLKYEPTNKVIHSCLNLPILEV